MQTQWKLLLAALALVGCGSRGGDREPTVETANALLTDTLVTLHPDGTFEQTVIEVTREQRAKEVEAQDKRVATESVATRTKRAFSDVASKASAVLRTDASCDYRDLWLYDAAQQNRLCIAYASLGPNESDSLDLSKIKYGRGCYDFPCTSYPTWAGRVSWIWSGFNPGGLYNPAPWALTAFDAWETQARAIDPTSSSIVYFVGAHLN